MHIMISYQSLHFFQSLSMIGHCASVIHSQTAKHSWVVSCFLEVIVYKNGESKEGIVQQRWKCNNEIKSDHAGNEIWVKYKWSPKISI